MKFQAAAIITLLVIISPLTSAEAVQTLAVSSAETQALGITSAPPTPAQQSIVLRANARVTIPPASEHSANALFGGFLARLMVGAGEQVSAGQLLAEINSTEFLQVQREYLAAASELKLSSQALQRDESLFNDGIISRRRLEETRERARAAGTLYAEHQQLLQMSGMNRQDLDKLDRSGQMLPVQPVRAPITGVILEQLGHTGDAITAQAPVFRLADLSTLWLDIRVNHADLELLSPGMSFQVNQSASTQPQAPGSTRASGDGTISVIGSLVDAQSQTVSVRGIVTSASTAGLHPDQAVSVTIYHQPTEGTGLASGWSIPAAALIRHQGEEFVFVSAGGTVEVKRVRATAATNGRVNVAEGLSGDDQVVVTGVAALKALWLAASET